MKTFLTLFITFFLSFISYCQTSDSIYITSIEFEITFKRFNLNELKIPFKNGNGYFILKAGSDFIKYNVKVYDKKNRLREEGKLIKTIIFSDSSFIYSGRIGDTDETSIKEFSGIKHYTYLVKDGTWVQYNAQKKLIKEVNFANKSYNDDYIHYEFKRVKKRIKKKNFIKYLSGNYTILISTADWVKHSPYR